MTKYKVKPDDLRDAVVAGIVFLLILIFVVEKHRREKGCTSCQQSAARNEEGYSLDDLLDAIGSHTNMPQVSFTPLSVDQIRRGY